MSSRAPRSRSRRSGSTAEEDSFDAALQPFRRRHRDRRRVQPHPDYETALQVLVDGGDPPDLAQIAQPGMMQQLRQRRLCAHIWTVVSTRSSSRPTSGPSSGARGSFDDTLYGVFYKGDVKSIVWYPVQAFEENGYEVPTTWDELIALSDQIIADGNGSPWCFSVRHTRPMTAGWRPTGSRTSCSAPRRRRPTRPGSITRSRSTTPRFSRPPN